MLAAYRVSHPALRQTVLRIGTILGASVRNQIKQAAGYVEDIRPAGELVRALCPAA